MDLDGVLGGDASDEEEREYQGKKSRGGGFMYKLVFGLMPVLIAVLGSR